MRKTLLSLVAAVMIFTPVFAATEGLPKQVIPECFGVQIHFFGNEDKQVKSIADAGYKFVRMDMFWHAIEKEKGKYDWTACDDLVNTLERHGVRLLFEVDFSNQLYSPDPKQFWAPADEEGRKGLAAFCKTAAARYKGKGIIWEFWNEPNSGFFWPPAPSPENYALAAKAMAQAIHEADPDAFVMGPGCAGIDGGFLDQIFQRGVLDYFDGVSVHPYRGADAPPETVIGNYQDLRALIARYAPKGKQIPVVCSEWGYTVSSMPKEQHARYLVRMALTNHMCGIPLSIWYDWHDDGTDPANGEHNFGIVCNDFTEKPAYFAMQTLSKELCGYHFIQRIYTGNPDDFIVLFNNGKAYKLAAWTIADKAHTIELPFDLASANSVDMYGKQPKKLNIKSGRLKLDLTRDVTYITIPGKSSRFAIEKTWEVTPGPVTSENGFFYTANCRLNNTTASPLKGIIVVKDLRGNALLRSPINVKADKLEAKTLSFFIPWIGQGPLGANIELKIDGIRDPLLRRVDYDSNRLPTVFAETPANGSTLMTIYNLSKESFTGSLQVIKSKGISFAEHALPVKIAKGQDTAELRFAAKFDNAQACTFTYALKDAKGRTIYTSTYPLVKTVSAFSDAKRYSWWCDGDGSVGASINVSTATPPPGLPKASSCLKVDYKLIGKGSSWKYFGFNGKDTGPIIGRPKKIGVWVYGDNSGNSIRLRLNDSTGQVHQPNIATLDFTGWKYLTWSLDSKDKQTWGGAGDGAVHWPIWWNCLFMIDSNREPHDNTIYIGPMFFIY